MNQKINNNFIKNIMQLNQQKVVWKHNQIKTVFSNDQQQDSLLKVDMTIPNRIIKFTNGFTNQNSILAR